MTHIQSTMVKMTNKFVEKSSLSSVTHHRRIMVVNCTQNCHLLVWPIYQAQWSNLQQILLKQHHYPVWLTTAKLWSSIAPKIATYSYDLYTKHNDENDQQFCWKIIIFQCNLSPPNYGRPLHPKLPPTRKTHIPNTIIKRTTQQEDKRCQQLPNAAKSCQKLANVANRYQQL